MSTIKKINETFLFKKINKIVQAEIDEPISISKAEKEYLWDRFVERFNEWIKVFHNVEAADLKNLKASLTKWNKAMDIKKKVNYQYGIYTWEVYASIGDNRPYDENGNFRYPYSAAIRFHNRLAKVFNDLGMWEKLYELVKPHTFVYSPRMRSLYSFDIRPRTIDLDGIKDYCSIPYHLPVENTMDSWFFAVSECLYFALGGYSYLSEFELTDNCNSHRYIEAMEHMRAAIDAGFGCIFTSGTYLIVFPELKYKYNTNFRIHCTNGAAIGHYKGARYYAINGVSVDEKVVKHPELITIDEILSQTNIEVKRIMIDRYGMEKFISDVGAEEVDAITQGDDRYQLLRLNLRDNEPWVVVKVVCPSTGRDYILRVPPNTQSVRQAIAWTFGMREDQYDPISES